MQFWCKVQTSSVCFVVAVLLTVSIQAQQLSNDIAPTAYEQVRDVPFQRMSLTEIPQTIPAAPNVTSIPNSVTPSEGSVISNAANTESSAIAAEPTTRILPLPEPRESQTGPNDVESSHVVIQPPLVQPYKSNQYSFVVENLGSIDAHDVTIEISVDESAKIMAMLPSDSVVTDRKALLKIKQLRAGEHSNIHLTATSETDAAIKFKAKLVHTSEQEFGAQSGETGIAVSPMINHQTTQSPAFGIEARPASTPTGNVPIVKAQPDYQPRPHFQTNPHFQGDQTGRKLPNHTSHQRSPFQSVSSGGLTTSVGPVAKRQTELPTTEHQFRPNHFGHTPHFSVEQNLPEVNTELSEEVRLPEIESIEPFSGPKNMNMDSIREFSLAITNPTKRKIKDVLVQLTVPEGFEIMTFDRQTWYDEETRTISFKVPELGASEWEAVNYQLKAVKSGFQIQKLVLEATGLESNEIRFDTYVND